MPKSWTRYCDFLHGNLVKSCERFCGMNMSCPLFSGIWFAVYLLLLDHNVQLRFYWRCFRFLLHWHSLFSTSRFRCYHVDWGGGGWDAHPHVRGFCCPLQESTSHWGISGRKKKKKLSHEAQCVNPHKNLNNKKKVYYFSLFTSDKPVNAKKNLQCINM